MDERWFDIRTYFRDDDEDDCFSRVCCSFRTMDDDVVVVAVVVVDAWIWFWSWGEFILPLGSNDWELWDSSVLDDFWTVATFVWPMVNGRAFRPWKE